jgi:hypothetical protein
VKTEVAFRRAGLSDLEEQVFRMLHGVRVEDNAQLEMRGQQDTSVRVRLEQMERRVLAHLQTSEDARRKQAIIAELRDIDEPA